jgi:hypothetical protein
MLLNAMDNSTATTYLNFGQTGGSNFVAYGTGTGTDFSVTPSICNSTVACGLLFAAANDSLNRDLLTATLEGSNASMLMLAIGF